MKVITMDCEAEIRYNDTDAAVELVKAHILGCCECNPKVKDLEYIEVGELLTVDGHMCKCVEVETVCNPRPPYKDQQRTYTFEVLPKRG